MKKTFHIQGMHCKSCELLLESACKEFPEITHVKASASKGTLEIERKHLSPKLEASIEHAVKEAGYHMGKEDNSPRISRDSKQWAITVGTILIILLVVLMSKDQGRDIANLMKQTKTTNNFFYPLLMGLIAGISTCMAIVGGIVASITAKRNEQHQNLTSQQRFLPQLYFQAGRIGGFIVLGGLLGLLGNIFLFDAKVMGIASILVGIVMLFLGIDLTKLFPRLRMVSIRLPFLGSNQPKGGAIIAGIVSFFLPCGFTLAMQLLAIQSGHFGVGALIMGSFALGTLPGLLGIGGILSRAKGNGAKILFSIVGILTLFFGGYTIRQGFTLITPNSNTSTDALHVSQDENREKFSMTYTTQGLTPASLTLEKGKSYQIIITPSITEQGCMSTILLPGLDSHISLIQKGEPITFTFTANKAGEFEFTCAMGLSHKAKIIIK